MIVNMVGLHNVLDFLNDLVKLDGDALARLIDTRVSCSSSMAQHPTVQVVDDPDSGEVTGYPQWDLWYIPRWAQEGVGSDSCHIRQ